MKKLHWYCFTFREKSWLGNAFVGYEEKKVNHKRIRDAKDEAKMHQSSAVLSICYLGFMTVECFEA